MRSVANRLRWGVLHALRRFHPDRETVAGEFDVAFYLAAYPDVAKAGADPIEHFLARGWREGRDPCRGFSVREYLDAYPDIGEAGVNPFVHYLRAGRSEGRKPRQDLGFRYDILSSLRSVEDRVSEAAQASAGVRTSPPGELARTLASSRTALKDVHVTFSHDDYSRHLGGVQLCLRREAAAVERAGRDHLHVYPAKPWPVLRTGEAAPLGVVWNGKPAGVHAPADIVRALEARVAATSFAIHSLLGHDVDETLAILTAVGLKRGFFWLHDFASLCAGFHLLRDDVEDCGAPAPDSAACGICIYGSWRARHLAEHARLFEALDLTVVSPSKPTLDLWRGASRFRTKGEVVLPHARLVETGRASPTPAARPLRVGFPGLAVTHKGWPVFKELALKHGADKRYEFHLFAAEPSPGLPVAFHPVSAGGHEANGMTRALVEAEIDVALVWPLCRETFSFTAHEAVAAGAAVITNPDSGNVAAFVRDGGHGWVLDDERALAAAFETGDVEALARRVRTPAVYDLEYSALTMDLIEAEAGA